MNKINLILLFVVLALVGCNNTKNAMTQTTAEPVAVPVEAEAPAKKGGPKTMAALEEGIVERLKNAVNIDSKQEAAVRSICQSYEKKTFNTKEEMNSMKRVILKRVTNEVLTASQKETMAARKRSRNG